MAKNAEVKTENQNIVDMENHNTEATEKTEEKVKKPNVFKRIAHGIGTGIRKVRESPVATAIGVGIGTAITIGAKALIDYRSARKHSDAIPIDDLVEIEDEGEEPIEEPTEEIETETEE